MYQKKKFLEMLKNVKIGKNAENLVHMCKH